MLTVLDPNTHVAVEIAEMMIESTHDALHQLIRESGRSALFSMTSEAGFLTTRASVARSAGGRYVLVETRSRRSTS
jgi:hypothetical protein